jgi:hypothetical protein
MHIDPVDAASERSRFRTVLVQAHQGIIGHRYHPDFGAFTVGEKPRLVFEVPHPLGIAERMKLLQKHVPQPRQLEQHPAGCSVQAFVLSDEVSGERAERGAAVLVRALFDEEDLQAVVVVPENNAVYRDVK